MVEVIEKELTIESLAKAIFGKIEGFNDFKSNNGFSGRFNILGDSKEGDIVIRHKIDEKGVEIANNKNLACLITKDPLENSIEVAKNLEFPIIVVDKIEIANAFALKWTINKFAYNSKKIVISGTNGKSTTSHLIYHILKSSGKNVFTNTDSKSEFNTLIDPMVSKLISDEVLIKSKKSNDLFNFDYLVIEVSEVQGWLDNLMKDHGYLMTDAINPDSTVITNIAMDHIGLVNSIDEVFEEISGIIKAIKKGNISLNADDGLLMSAKNNAKDVGEFFFSMNNFNTDNNYLNINKNHLINFNPENNCIIYEDEAILKIDNLPFKSYHFIQNILAAISACISLNIPLQDIISGVKSYKPLKRRFSKIHDSPLIIDDFAHNPDGIKATIKGASNLTSGKLWIICAIRGSRGEEINKINAKSLIEAFFSLNDDFNNKFSKKNNSFENKIILSNSDDIVDNLNIVTNEEEKIFKETLNKNKIEFTHYNKLKDALEKTYHLAENDDTILLIGAQGMDPAESLLNTIVNKKIK